MTVWLLRSKGVVWTPRGVKTPGFDVLNGPAPTGGTNTSSGELISEPPEPVASKVLWKVRLSPAVVNRNVSEADVIMFFGFPEGNRKPVSEARMESVWTPPVSSLET